MEHSNFVENCTFSFHTDHRHQQNVKEIALLSKDLYQCISYTQAFFVCSFAQEWLFYSQYFFTGFFEKETASYVFSCIKYSILIFCGVYILRIILKVRQSYEKNLVRHQNLIVISLFYQIAFGLTMFSNYSEFANHPAHLIVYNSLPTLYLSVLMFLYSVQKVDDSNVRNMEGIQVTGVTDRS